MRKQQFTMVQNCTQMLPDNLRAAISASSMLFIFRGAKIQANELRPGNILNHNGQLVQVVKAVHAVGQGRQLGNVQVEVKELNTKRKLSLRHRPYDTLEKIRLDSKTFQFLYSEGETLFVMNPVTYEQLTVEKTLFGDQAKWLTDGMEVSLSVLSDGQAVLGEVPQTLTLKVKEAAAYAKGDTAGATVKPCVLENGIEISVPSYVQSGQQIVVNTSDGSFVRRVA